MADPSLNIWIGGRVVAVLHQGRSGLSITYVDEEIRRSGVGAVILSISLPVRSKRFSGDSVNYWLEGLLPEGEARTTLESIYDVRRGDTFGLLTSIGRECAGAVAFLPDGQSPEPPGEPRPLTDAQLARAIAELPAYPLGDTPETGISLGGLQEKLLVCRVGNTWARPTNGAPSTHIMKPDPTAHPGRAGAEAFAMQLAANAGISAATVGLLDVDGRSVIVVERFDRLVTPEGTRRIHQEDACQALGSDSRDRRKYQEADGGPSYGKIAELIRAHAVNVDTELRTLAEAMILTVAVGNTDAHGKNHGFLIRNGTISVAPVYDVAPTVAFVSRRDLAMFIGDEHRIDRVTKMRLALEAQSWGIPRSDAIDIVDDTVRRIADALSVSDAGLISEECRRVISASADSLAASSPLVRASDAT